MSACRIQTAPTLAPSAFSARSEAMLLTVALRADNLARQSRDALRYLREGEDYTALLSQIVEAAYEIMRCIGTVRPPTVATCVSCLRDEGDQEEEWAS